MSQSNPLAGRIQLRQVADNDLPIFFEHYLDPEANYMAAFTSGNPEDRQLFDMHWAHIRQERDVVIRTILFDEQVAGYVLSYLSKLGTEISYWLGKEFWGKGITSAALSAFLEVQQTRPLYGRAAKDNAASLRVMQKCGFVVTGEERAFAHARGEEISEMVLVLK